MAYPLRGNPKAFDKTYGQDWTPRDLKLRDLTNQVTFNNTEPLGVGGAADVYQGTLGTTTVALKIPRFLSRTPEKDTKRRFWREIECWSKLKHRNILEMMGLVFEDQSAYVVSLWAQNGTVAQYVKANPGIQRYPLVHGIIAGIHHLHENNVIHGDIKGNNILISDDGSPQITDFGLSKAPAGVTSSAIAGAGTMQWCAPELFEGKTKTKATDVYATAMVIYEVLALQMPYEWLSPMEMIVIQSMLKGTRPPCTPRYSTTGEDFAPYWKLAQSGWAASPSDRPVIGELLSRLDLITPKPVQPAHPIIVPEPLIEIPLDTQTEAEAEPTILQPSYMNMQRHEAVSPSSIPVQHDIEQSFPGDLTSRTASWTPSWAYGGLILGLFVLLLALKF